MRIISKLIYDISRVLQNYLNILKELLFLFFLLLSASGVFPVILIFDLDDSEFAMLS